MIGSRIAVRTLAEEKRPRAPSASPCSPMRMATIALALLTTPSACAAAGPLRGDASVIDGDTIKIGGERIQLYGVDAPEDWQFCRDETGADYQCGKKAALALEAFLSASRPTRCRFAGRDRYGRYIGACFRADGKDVNQWLVESGHAVSREENHDKGLYAAAQEMARSVGAGMWRGQARAEGSNHVAEE
ncbi:succinoglycan biosynthesis protein ExoI [Sinorhizobium americanum]|uniref:Succinoglycan biosynthesis protein ExoI n=2 Tax=Sinorhizobium americanum TaxID=194963 RepID=A0A4R2C186_9HYPH|nr:succinoglycan biosynthesis protein ExoI [Sinorhizobium americanum]